MIHAYNDNYVECVSDNLGELFHKAIFEQGYNPDEFASIFAESTVARGIEHAHPLYLAGMSSTELLEEITGKNDGYPPVPEDRSQGYWTGYIIALAQHSVNCSFRKLFSEFPCSRIYSLYHPMHEADESSMIELIDKKIHPENILRAKRVAMGYSQSKLALISQVNLRSIIAYEHGEIELENASGITLYRLAHTLGCSIEDLLLRRQ